MEKMNDQSLSGHKTGKWEERGGDSIPAIEPVPPPVNKNINHMFQANYRE